MGFYTSIRNWIIPAAHCPHYNEDERKSFDEMMIGESIPGIALEDNTALVEIDGKYKIIKADKNRKAYILKSNSNSILKEELDEGKFFQI